MSHPLRLPTELSVHLVLFYRSSLCLKESDLHYLSLSRLDLNQRCVVNCTGVKVPRPQPTRPRLNSVNDSGRTRTSATWRLEDACSIQLSYRAIVPQEGFEPSIPLRALDFKSSLYASSSTKAKLFVNSLPWVS